jgi:hypothetical protein
MSDYTGLDTDKQARVKTRLEAHKSGLDSITLIPLLQNKANSARTTLLTETIAEVDRLAHPPQTAFTPKPGMDEAPARAPQAPSYVTATEIKVPFAKPYLSNDADVDDYVAQMKTTLLEQIHAGKKVIV